MKILLSNDDGYQAPGLCVLHDALCDSHDLKVVAPSKNCSGYSSALTLNQSVKVERMQNGFYILHGTPADCVHFAVNGVFDWQPDLVISGINNGENLANDVLYSGTVGAALEGRFQRLPAIAISLVGTDLNHYESAAKVAQHVVNKLQSEPLPAGIVLNINVPDVAYHCLKGYQVTQLGDRKRSNPVGVIDATGGYYYIGAQGSLDGGADSDFLAVEQDKVSITPLSVDMTDYHNIQVLSDWFE